MTSDLPVRLVVLAVAAVAGVGVVLWDGIGGSAASVTVTPPRPSQSAGEEPPPPGAPPGQSDAELAERYAAIDEADPFAPRSFRPPRRRPERGRPEPSREPEERRPEPDPPEETLELRLTGLVGAAEGRQAILEQRGSGKGLLAGAGRTLGPVSVAAVESRTVTVVEGEDRRRLALGDELELPVDLVVELDRLGPPEPDPELLGGDASGPSAPSDAEPELSEEKKQSILERLRARRARSLREAEED